MYAHHLFSNFQIFQSLLPIVWRLFWAHRLLSISPSTSCPIFIYLTRSKYLSFFFFLFSFNFSLRSVGMTNSTTEDTKIVIVAAFLWLGSRVKWSNSGNGVALSPTPRCFRYCKRGPSGSPRLWWPTKLFWLIVSSLSPHNQYLLLIYFSICIVCPDDVVLCCYQKSFTFSLNVSKPWFLVWAFARFSFVF